MACEESRKMGLHEVEEMDSLWLVVVRLYLMKEGVTRRDDADLSRDACCDRLTVQRGCVCISMRCRCRCDIGIGSIVYEPKMVKELTTSETGRRGGGEASG